MTNRVLNLLFKHLYPLTSVFNTPGNNGWCLVGSGMTYCILVYTTLYHHVENASGAISAPINSVELSLH